MKRRIILLLRLNLLRAVTSPYYGCNPHQRPSFLSPCCEPFLGGGKFMRQKLGQD